MPRTDPLPNWDGDDVFVIGGGPSLRGFDWTALHEKNTIGCNQAFTLGDEVCDICTFGDFRFWQVFGEQLDRFGGWVATNYQRMPCPPPWLYEFKRNDHGLSSGDTLAWNGNTGCLATNLALSLGARRVLLLGFDMGIDEQSPEKESHWHDLRISAPRPEVYRKFRSGFSTVAAHLPEVFPGRQIFNVSNGASKLDIFPILTFDRVGLPAPAIAEGAVA